MSAVFTCDKCGETPEGEPTGVLSFVDKEGEMQTPFPITLCESCAPKAYRLLVKDFLKLDLSPKG